MTTASSVTHFIFERMPQQPLALGADTGCLHCAGTGVAPVDPAPRSTVAVGRPSTRFVLDGRGRVTDGSGAAPTPCCCVALGIRLVELRTLAIPLEV